MIYVGIDVSKDKHDCTIVSSDGVVLADVFTIQNNLDGFNLLFQRIKSVAPYLAKVKVGLEATGHYSYNILGFLLDKGLHTFVINPLHTNLFRKSTSLRRTKTDRVDARTIAAMMMSGVVLKSYDHEQRENQCCQSLFHGDTSRRLSVLRPSSVVAVFSAIRGFRIVHLPKSGCFKKDNHNPS